MKHCWSSLTMLAICVLSAAVQLDWAGHDKHGQFHPDYLWANGNLGTSLFFIGPYMLFAATALMVWRNRAARSCLVLVAVLCGIGLLAGWTEHEQYLRTPPGRETQPMLHFFAAILLWISSVVQFVVVAVLRIASRKKEVT